MKKRIKPIFNYKRIEQALKDRGFRVGDVLVVCKQVKRVFYYIGNVSELVGSVFANNKNEDSIIEHLNNHSFLLCDTYIADFESHKKNCVHLDELFPDKMKKNEVYGFYQKLRLELHDYHSTTIYKRKFMTVESPEPIHVQTQETESKPASIKKKKWNFKDGDVIVDFDNKLIFIYNSKVEETSKSLILKDHLDIVHHVFKVLGVAEIYLDDFKNKTGFSFDLRFRNSTVGLRKPELLNQISTQGIYDLIETLRDEIDTLRYEMSNQSEKMLEIESAWAKDKEAAKELAEHKKFFETFKKLFESSNNQLKA